MLRKFTIATLLTLCVQIVMAQDVVVPHKVENVTVKDLKGQSVTIPYFGEKNLFIFYIDPDTGLGGNANYKYSDILEEKGVTNGPNMFGFGILNLADTKLPKGIVRSMARRRTAKNNGLVLDDTSHALRDAWGLGDCNGKFCFMIVTKQGELVFLQKDAMTKEEQQDFLTYVEQYR